MLAGASLHPRDRLVDGAGQGPRPRPAHGQDAEGNTMSDWTVDTLRELMDQRFADQEKAVQAALAAAKEAVAAALAAAEKAVVKAELSSKDRLDAHNGLQQQLENLMATLMPRVEAEQRIATNADKIDVLAARLDKMDGRSHGLSAGWGVLVAAMTLIIGVVAVYAALR